MIRGSGSKELFQHGCVTGISEFLIEVVLDEVEKSQQVRVAATLCLLLSSLRDPCQKGEDPLRSYLPKVFVPEIHTDFGKNQLVRPQEVLLRMGFVVLKANDLLLNSIALET